MEDWVNFSPDLTCEVINSVDEKSSAVYQCRRFGGGNACICIY